MGPTTAIRRAAVVLAMWGILMLLVMPLSAASVGKKAGGVAKYVVINVLLAVADYESAHAVQHRGGCLESNPLFGQYPSRARFYSEGLAIDAGPEVLGWLLHHKHARMWQAPFAVVATWHGEGLATNLRCAAR